MKVFKPLQACLLHNNFDWKGRPKLVVSVFFGFPFDGGELLLEQDVWELIAGETGQGGIFDMGMPKPNGEALLYGSYFPPEGKPASAGEVRMSVGPIDKTLLVFGNRYWRAVLGPSEPEPFRVMPLNYQNAFGGTGHEMNPTGKGMVEVDVFGEKRLPLPNIEHPSHLMTSSSQRPEPAGFGPLDVAWAFRASKLGTYDEKWIRERAPAYADDLDWNHFNAAPRDQWLEAFFSGDEAFELRNMHPDKRLLKGQLPGLRAKCFVERKNSDSEAFEEVGLRAETVWFMPHAETGIVLYRGVIDVSSDDASDIENLLVAYENSADEGRDLSYYHHALKNRLSPETSMNYMMDTTDIIPENAKCGFALLNEQSPSGEGAKHLNQEAHAERIKEETENKLEAEKQRAAQMLKAQGIAPEPYLAKVEASAKPELDPKTAELNKLAEQIVPKSDSKNGVGDLKSINFGKIGELAAKAEEFALDKKKALKDELQGLSSKLSSMPEAAQQKLGVDAALKALDKPLLPRPPGHGIIENLKAQKLQADKLRKLLEEQGGDDSSIPDIDIDEVRQGLEAAQAQAKEGYRMVAHLFEKGRPAHEEQLELVRDQFLEKVRNREDVTGGDYAGVDLSHQDLSGVDLSGCYFEGANLSDAKLCGAKLENTIFSHAVMKRCDLSDANLNGANLGAADLSNAIVLRAEMSGCKLGKSVLTGARLTECNLTGAEFVEAKMKGVTISSSFLPGSEFVDLDISGADFSQSTLTGSGFTSCNLQQTSFIEAILDDTNWIESNLNACDFSSARMINSRFPGGCTLRGAKFVRAMLDKSNLRETDLRDADFTEASMNMCEFGEANAEKATFYRADAKSAQFIGTNLGEANLSSVNLMEGTLLKARLTSAVLKDSNCYAVEFLNATVGGTDFSGTNLDDSKLEKWSPRK